jgi:predicted transcriptional regulator
MWMQFSLPRETAAKIQRLEHLVLDGSKTPFTVLAMPGQRHPDKTTLSVYLPRTLMQRLRRLASDRRQSVTQVIENMVTDQTREVVLLPEDYEIIAAETRLAQGSRSNPRKAKGGRKPQ